MELFHLSPCNLSETPLKCYGGSSELLARATRGRALIENETDGVGLEHCRTGEPMGVSLFRSFG